MMRSGYQIMEQSLFLLPGPKVQLAEQVNCCSTGCRG